ncbi:MAG: nitrous oxidase accessory protein NosD, partial [Myxococcota bacterium]
SPSLELLTHLQARIPALRVPSVIDPSPLTRAPEGPSWTSR